ncbi:hypothetical protein RvY_19162 [Ramazzottius varieornatus]|uniref:Uncharacterized protein n=1 Tax=Ramazzottius varieornatus TaxID=947166 RepID=A0A1D1W8G3_RAMVA|nr:hypothetical protein RvY_19162 [Ramazzottius varieornatus]
MPLSSIGSHRLVPRQRTARQQAGTPSVRRHTQAPASPTEPSSHELFFPRIPDPRVLFDQAADVDYKKRAVNFWPEPVTKKRRSLSCVQKIFVKDMDI